MDKEELIKLVERLQTADFASDEEGSELLQILERNVIHPAVANLIFWNAPELSAEEIVKRALSYKPIPLPEKFD
jgi:hypothetical protein